MKKEQQEDIDLAKMKLKEFGMDPMEKLFYERQEFRRKRMPDAKSAGMMPSASLADMVFHIRLWL